MTTKPQRKIIAVNDLLNDEKNPRHPEVSNQPEAIAWMLNEYKSEIINIADDIGTHGLSLLETMMAIPSEKQKGKYTVIEGNRRLLAIRLLNKPTLADDSKLTAKFETLQKKHKGHIPHSIDVLLVPDRKTYHWMIERRHSGLDKGRGLRPWTAQQKGRAERNNTGVAQRYEQALQVIDYAIDSNLLGADSKRLQATEFNTTNLERLLADANVRHKLGINFDNNTLTFILEPEEVHKGFSRILSDILGDLSVSSIKNAQQRRDYIDSLGDDTPNPKKKLDTPILAKDVPAEKKPKGGTKSKPHGHKRHHIIDTPIRVKDSNVNKVYNELKTLDIDNYPAACGGLIRSFLEQSLDHYITARRVHVTPQKGHRVTLKEKVIAVYQSMNTHSLLVPAHYKALEQIRNGQAGIADPEHLHMGLHSSYHYPRKQDLIDIWDSHYGPLLSAIWKELK